MLTIGEQLLLLAPHEEIGKVIATVVAEMGAAIVAISVVSSAATS